MNERARQLFWDKLRAANEKLSAGQNTYGHLTTFDYAMRAIKREHQREVANAWIEYESTNVTVPLTVLYAIISLVEDNAKLDDYEQVLRIEFANKEDSSKADQRNPHRHTELSSLAPATKVLRKHKAER